MDPHWPGSKPTGHMAPWRGQAPGLRVGVLARGVPGPLASVLTLILSPVLGGRMVGSAHLTDEVRRLKQNSLAEVPELTRGAGTRTQARPAPSKSSGTAPI